MYGAWDSKPFLGPAPHSMKGYTGNRHGHVYSGSVRTTSGTHHRCTGRIMDHTHSGSEGGSQFVPIRPPPPQEVSLSRFLRREMRAFLPRTGKGWEGVGPLFSA